MKWFATLKWEIKADVMTLRWFVLPALAVWGLLMLLSLPALGLAGRNFMWFAHLPVALAGIYLGIAHPFNRAMWLLKRYRLAERLTARPIYVVAVVRLPLNIIIVAAGFALLYMSGIVHQRFGLEWFNFAFFELLVDGLTISQTPRGSVIEYIYYFSVLAPSFLLALTLITNKRVSNRLAIATIAFVLISLIGAAFWIDPGQIVSAFEGMGLWQNSIAVAVVFTVLPIVYVVIASWLYEKKIDFDEVKS